MKTFSIKEACDVLGISRSTLNRKLKDGSLQCTRSAEKQAGFEQTVFFTPEQLGLTEQQIQARASGRSHDVPINACYEGEKTAPAAKAIIAPAPRRAPAPELDQRELADIDFAERFKAGNATDSLGNTISGNRRWPTLGVQSLLGPMEPRKRQRLYGHEHMNPGLFNNDPVRTDGINSDAYNERWSPGAAERQAQRARDAGVRPRTEQERKQTLDVAAIRAAFRQGYSR